MSEPIIESNPIKMSELGAARNPLKRSEPYK
jgi:hypothetical protein